MDEILKFLNQNAGALSAVFSGVVTLATIFYAVLTARLLTETRQMREVQTEPLLQVTYKTRDEWINFLDISVKNIGLGPAKNIDFSITSISKNPGAQELLASLTKLIALANGLNYLGPGQQLTSFWTSLVEGANDKVDSSIKVTCRYESATRVKYKHDFILDLTELKGTTSLGEPPLLSISKQLESIAKNVQKLISGFSRVSVNIYTEEDRSVERTALRERARQEKQAKSKDELEPD